MIKPLKETILMDKFDTTATRTRIPKRIIGITRVPANSANIFFIFVIIVVLCGWRRRRCGGFHDLLSLGNAWRRSGRGRIRRRGRVGDGIGGDRGSVERRRWFVSDLHHDRGPSPRG
jgi:hypothetical protein